MYWNIKTESAFSVLPPVGKTKWKWEKDVQWGLNLWHKKRSARLRDGYPIPFQKATVNSPKAA